MYFSAMLLGLKFEHSNQTAPAWPIRTKPCRPKADRAQSQTILL